MEKDKKLLSDIIVHMKYARYLPEKNRRETWEEIVDRNKEMHKKRYPEKSQTIDFIWDSFVKTKRVLPSMRSMQFAGKPIELNESRIYNCSYLPIDHPSAFQEVMFLLLSGVGVGFSVQSHHIACLPTIKKRKGSRRYVINDSLEGWADTVKMLMKSYFKGSHAIDFVYDEIRPKGAKLVTSGGKAPGPAPLKRCVENIQNILEAKPNKTHLTSLEVHDIVCHIADAVLAGGIRRSALISLFDKDDEKMLTCKAGNWWEKNGQRGRANNSAVLERDLVSYKEFSKVFDSCKDSHSGEPGVYFTNNKDWGTNPCVEIALRPFQMCNLTEINVSDVRSQEDLEERAYAAAFIGTLQAGYTNFGYLRPIWRETCEKDALLGVSMTGISSMEVFKYDIRAAVEKVRKTNERISKDIGIKKSARLTCVKPAGTTSLVLGTASGIHAWHDKYYIRRVRVGKNEAIYKYLRANLPNLIEDSVYDDTQAVIAIPQKAPENAVTREESAMEFLSRVKNIYTNWVSPGHNRGTNRHNVSATVNAKEHEWESIKSWMWKNRDNFNGLSLLPYDGGSYSQAPFETISKEDYSILVFHLKSLDLSKIRETDDNTDLQGELACSGGSCEVT